MKNIKIIIDSINDCYKGKKATKDDIIKAESKLELSFSSSYKIYLEEYGNISFDDVELAGLTKDKSNNVIDLTNRLRKIDNKIEKEFYVIENVGIDKIMMISNVKDEIFLYKNGKKIKKYNSFVDYIESLLKSDNVDFNYVLFIKFINKLFRCHYTCFFWEVFYITSD